MQTAKIYGSYSLSLISITAYFPQNYQDLKLLPLPLLPHYLLPPPHYLLPPPPLPPSPPPYPPTSDIIGY